MLLEFFRNWRRNRRRRIYRYFDGLRNRYADPVALQFALANHPTYLPRHLAEARAGDVEAIAVLCDVAQGVFGAHGIDARTGKGLSAGELATLVIDFEVYCVALKKNTKPWLGWQPSTDAT